jgi:hypothetical protein
MQEVGPPAEPQVVEFPWISLYSKNATRLSAGFFRVRTGWRRDEWAESPLFICGKSCPKTLKNQGNVGVLAAGKAAGQDGGQANDGGQTR